MAHLEMYRDRLKHNFKQLDKLFKKNNIQWGVTTKMLCGHKPYLKEVLALGPQQVCEARLTNLKVIKQIDPNIETMYIKPTPRKSIRSLVKFADISLNTELATIKLIAEEARRQKCIHKIIIMLEMGDLREGILGQDIVKFYEKVFRIKGIEVIGIGTNLNCLFGVMPSHDKLVQLGLYRQILELKFNQKLPVISGGSTVTIPLIYKKQLPLCVNHFRVGEALFFGADLFEKTTLPGFFPNVFQLFTEIIELYEKPSAPIGELDLPPSGEKIKIKESDYGRKAYRAIVDIGSLDVSPEYLVPEDPDLTIVRASSDMLVVELSKGKKKYTLGSIIKFNIKYMGVLTLMNSRYIDKKVI